MRYDVAGSHPVRFHYPICRLLYRVDELKSVLRIYEKVESLIMSDGYIPAGHAGFHHTITQQPLT